MPLVTRFVPLKLLVPKHSAQPTMLQSDRGEFSDGEVAYLWEQYFALGRAEIKPEMLAAIICREMKWTFEEYQNQPSWFIDIILEMLQAESAEAKKKQREQ